jgi:hypothetical protein
VLDRIQMQGLLKSIFCHTKHVSLFRTRECDGARSVPYLKLV